MESDTAVNHDETELSFAAKIDYLQPSGAYNTTLEFNIVANPLVNYMQDLNPALCTTTPMTVVDKRDNQEYIIQRLNDGNCWMVSNLNLGVTNLTQELNSTNTNIITPIPAATFNSWRKTIGTAQLAVPEFIPVSGTDSVSQVPYGTTYNFCVASGNTICTASNTVDASYDICPAGWRLPTNNEYINLYNLPAYNSYDKIRASVADGGPAFSLNGVFYDSSLDCANPSTTAGTFGVYWTSTRNNTTNTRMYDFHIRGDTQRVQTNLFDHRSWGLSVRCLAK